MEKKLNWFDRVITPKTKAYKDFEKEIKNTAPEIFLEMGKESFLKRRRCLCRYINPKKIS